jgi:hypothetical protein
MCHVTSKPPRDDEDDDWGDDEDASEDERCSESVSPWEALMEEIGRRQRARA